MPPAASGWPWGCQRPGSGAGCGGECGLCWAARCCSGMRLRIGSDSESYLCWAVRCCSGMRSRIGSDSE
eukprot:scaffold6361_cov132-Isochrysis_galbana.AAC.11